MNTIPSVADLKVTKTKIEPLQRFVIYNVPWEQYEALLELWNGRHIRLTYDRGTLELMTTSSEHEMFKKIWARLVETLSFELRMPIASRGEMTFKRQLKERGLEPDECYWFDQEPAIRGKKRVDIDRDPPPQLVLEIEVTESALDKIDIYASLGFPEVWRFDGESIHIHRLRDEGKYLEAETGGCFPTLPTDELTRWLFRGLEMEENSLIREYIDWIREGMPRGLPL
jgi:Uma2 family endonuclease